MSKAFVNEDDGADDELEADDSDDAPSKIPASGKNYITPQGAQTLRDELQNLLNVERPKMVETVAWAASNGDRSENADYIYGKRRLREIDRRLRFLQKRLDSAVIVDPTQQKGDRVLFGATVTVRDENQVEKTFSIVGVDETNAKTGRVSWLSPIGQALLQAKIDDVVILKTPHGEEELEVLRIEYKPLT